MNSGGSISLNDYGSDNTPNGGFGGFYVDATGSVTGNVQFSGNANCAFNQMNGTLNGSLRLHRFTNSLTFAGTQATAGKRLDLHNGSFLTLSGTFTASAGVQVDHGSTLTLSGNERLGVGTTGVLQLAGGTLSLGGTNVTQTFATAGALSLVSSLGYYGRSQISVSGTSGTATLVFGTAGGNTALAAGTVTGPGTLHMFLGTGGAVQFQNTSTTNGLIGGGITAGVTGGTLEWATLSGVNAAPLGTYQTGTNPNAWLTAENVKVSAAPSANLTANRTINSLHMASENTLTLNAGTTLKLTTGGVIGYTAGSGSSVYRYQYINGGTITADAATSGGWLKFILGQGANTLETRLTVNSVISNDGANTVGLVKSGTGTVYLGGANTFSGNVHVQSGTFSIAAANNLGNTPTVFMTGGSLETTASMTLTQRLDVGTSNGTLSMSANTLTLSAANPILGTNRGSLNISGSAGGTVILSNTDGGVADIGVLGISPSNTLRLGTRTTGASLLGASTFLNLAGTLDGSWGNTTAVGAVNGGGTFKIRGGNTLTIGATDYPASSAPVFSGAFTQEVNGLASGTAANLVKVGAGIQHLSGASSYTGTTSLLGGTLWVAANVTPSTNGPLGNATSALLHGNTTGSDDVALQLEGGFTFARPITVQAGSTGLVSIGGRSSGTSTYSGAIALNRTVEAAATNTLMFSGPISGAGGIVKSGNGTLTFSGNNTYSGSTIVSEGTVLVNGQTASNSGTGTGSVTVLSNATLGGNGLIAPTGGNTVTVRGGTITAGTGIGASTLTIASNGLTLDGGQYLVKLYGIGYTNSSTTDISKLSVTGNVTISSTSLIRLDLSAISAADVTTMRAGGSRVYNVIEGTGSVSNFQAGNFSILSLGQFMAGEWTFLTSPTSGTVQLNFTPVPEPASALAFGALGLAAVGGLRRLRRK